MNRTSMTPALETKLNDTLARVATVDLDRIRTKVQAKLGWSDERAVEAEEQYRRYLTLLLLEPNLRITPPSQDVDEIWHGHILDTLAYQADCERLFGRYLHHVPSYGTPTEKLEMAAAREETDRAFLRYFGSADGLETEASFCICIADPATRQTKTTVAAAGCVPCLGAVENRATKAPAIASRSFARVS